MLKKIFLLLVLFLATYLYINNPLFAFNGGIESIRWLYVLIPLALLYSPALFSAYIKKVRPYVAIFVVILLYCSLITLAGGEMRYFSKLVAAVIENVLLPFVFLAIFQMLQFTEKQFITAMLIFGCACALFSVLCIINPTLDSYIREVLVMNNEYLVTHLYRGFGLSNSLTYAYGISLGIILATGIYYINDNKWFIFMIPFVFISIILNARTGIIIAAAGFASYFLIKRKVSSYIVGSIVLIALIFSLSKILSSSYLSEGSLVFLEDFEDAITGYAKGEDAGSISVLRSQWQWPSDLSGWLVGRGINIFYDSSRGHSDIGYFIQLNYGGLVYIALLLCLVYRVAKFFFENKKSFFGLFFILTFIIANYKGQFLLASGCFRLYILIMVFYVYSQIMTERNKQIKNYY